MRTTCKRKLANPHHNGPIRAGWWLAAPLLTAITPPTWGQGVALRPRTDVPNVPSVSIAPRLDSNGTPLSSKASPGHLDTMASGYQRLGNRSAPTSNSVIDPDASTPSDITISQGKSKPATALGSLGPMRVIPASPLSQPSAYPTSLGWSASRPRYGADDPEAVRRPRLIEDLASRNALDPSYDSESTVPPSLAPSNIDATPAANYSVRHANYQVQGEPYGNPFAETPSNLPVLPGNSVLSSAAPQGPVLPNGNGGTMPPVLPPNPYGSTTPVLPGNTGPVLPSTVSPSLNTGQTAANPVMPPYGGPFARPEDRRITIGEPFVTEPPCSFDAYWMVHPANYQTGRAQATTTLTSPTGAPYTGTQMPYRVVPPTIMPNQAPQLYAWNAGSHQPLVSLGQDRYNVQLGRGIVGQPTVYVPGQSFRNFLRYLSP